MPKEHPKNDPKSGQHGSKIDPSWGHVGLQNRLGPAEDRRENDTEKDTAKSTPKHTEHKPVNAWNGKRAFIVDPEGDVRTCVCTCLYELVYTTMEIYV